VARPYRCPHYSGRVVLLRAVHYRYPNPFGRRKDGWEFLLTGEVHGEDIACNHDEIVTEPFVEEVAQRMERHMARVEGRNIPSEVPARPVPTGSLNGSEIAESTHGFSSKPLPA
jgi:hypothetical protein